MPLKAGDPTQLCFPRLQTCSTNFHWPGQMFKYHRLLTVAGQFIHIFYCYVHGNLSLGMFSIHITMWPCCESLQIHHTTTLHNKMTSQCRITYKGKNRSFEDKAYSKNQPSSIPICPPGGHNQLAETMRLWWSLCKHLLLFSQEKHGRNTEMVIYCTAVIHLSQQPTIRAPVMSGRFNYIRLNDRGQPEMWTNTCTRNDTNMQISVPSSL